MAISVALVTTVEVGGDAMVLAISLADVCWQLLMVLLW